MEKPPRPGEPVPTALKRLGRHASERQELTEGARPQQQLNHGRGIADQRKSHRGPERLDPGFIGDTLNLDRYLRLYRPSFLFC
jgi:hypothetical protein